MRIEDFQALQQQTKPPGERRQPARERRRQGDACEGKGATWKQAPDLGWPDAARLRVGRVEPEIIPQDHPAWPGDPQQLARQIALDFLIQDGGENRELHAQVKTVRRVRQVLPVGAGQRQASQGMSRRL